MREFIIYGNPEPLALLDVGNIRYSDALHAHTEDNILCKDGRVHFGPEEFGTHFVNYTDFGETLWCGYYEHCFNKGPVHSNDWYWNEEQRCFIEMATLSEEDFLAVALSNADRITIH